MNPLKRKMRDKSSNLQQNIKKGGRNNCMIKDCGRKSNISFPGNSSNDKVSLTSRLISRYRFGTPHSITFVFNQNQASAVACRIKHRRRNGVCSTPGKPPENAIYQLPLTHLSPFTLTDLKYHSDDTHIFRTLIAKKKTPPLNPSALSKLPETSPAQCRRTR